MMDQKLIVIGQYYENSFSREKRKVLGIDDDDVFYAVDGIVTFMPEQLSLRDFSSWADKQVGPRLKRDE